MRAVIVIAVAVSAGGVLFAGSIAPAGAQAVNCDQPQNADEADLCRQVLQRGRGAPQTGYGSTTRPALPPASQPMPIQPAVPEPSVPQEQTLVPRGNEKPSFDCAQAKTAAARLICADPELARLDGELGTAFQKRKAQISAPDQSKFVTEQLAWIRTRNTRCELDGKNSVAIEMLASSKPCMASAIRERITALLPTDSAAAQTLPAAVGTPSRSEVKPSQRDDNSPTDFSSIMLKPLECDRAPLAGKVIHQLIRLGIAQAKPFKVADSQNYFALDAPKVVDGLTAVAVVGFDETGDSLWVRSPGTSPGPLLGLVTKDSLYQVDEWRKRRNRDLKIDDSMSGIPNTKDVVCARFDEAAVGESAPSITARSQPNDQPILTGITLLFVIGFIVWLFTLKPIRRVVGGAALVVIVVLGIAVLVDNGPDKPTAPEPKVEMSPSEQSRALEEQIAAERLFADVKVCIVASFMQQMMSGETSETAMQITAAKDCAEPYKTYVGTAICKKRDSTGCDRPEHANKVFSVLIKSVFDDMVRTARR